MLTKLINLINRILGYDGENQSTVIVEDAQAVRSADNDFKKSIKRMGLIALMVLIMILGTRGAVAIISYGVRCGQYNKAVEYYNSAGYDKAYKLFSKITRGERFKDSSDYLEKIDEFRNEYSIAVKYFEGGRYSEAVQLFKGIMAYNDAFSYVDKCSDELYKYGENCLKQREYDRALESLSSIPEDAECFSKAQLLLASVSSEKEAYEKELEEKRLKSAFDGAVKAFNEGYLEGAQRNFIELGDYPGAGDYLDEIGKLMFKKAESAYERKDYKEAQEWLLHIDSSEEWSLYTESGKLSASIKAAIVEEDNRTKYDAAVELFNEGEYSKAQKEFSFLWGYRDSQSYYERAGEFIVGAAKDLFKKGNYLGCAEKLLELNDLQQNAGADELYEMAKTANIQDIISEARSISRKEEDDEKVREFLYSKKSMLLSEDEIINLEPECFVSKIRLMELEPFDKYDVYLCKGIVKDNYGNTWSEAIIGSGMTSHTRYARYFLDGNYSYLTATVANEKGCSADYDQGVIRIYGDGRLLFSDNSIGVNTKPYAIELNLEGISELQVEVYATLGWTGHGAAMLCEPFLVE